MMGSAARCSVGFEVARSAARGRARRRFAGFVAGAALIATAAACSGSTTGNSSSGTVPPANQAAPKTEVPAVEGGTLKVGLSAEVDGMNPVSSRWSIDGNMVASSVFDPLMTFDENRNLVPKLAESVKPNDAGTEWTIKLRPGITFHDGTPLDAAAVKLNIEARKQQPLTGGALAPVESVTVQDPLTAVVKMNTPWFGYDYTIAAQGGYMAAPAQIKSNDVKKAVGTGPFMMDGEFTPGKPIVVKKNPTYWGDKAHLDGMTFTAIVDEQGRINALKAHDVDLILTQNAEGIKAFRDTPGIKQIEDVAGEEAYAMMNMATPPFDNIHARKAVAYATNPQELVDTIGDGVLKPANGPFIEGERFYNPDAGYVSYDLEKAKAEIEAYKKDTGKADLEFTIKSDVGEKHVAEPLQGQLTAAGIKATVDLQEQVTYLAAMFLGNFQMSMFRNFAYVNPDSNYIFWHSSQAKGIGVGSINFGQLKSPELDKLLDEARGNKDDASRAEQYKKLTPVLNASFPYVWLYHTDWALAGDEKVGGLTVPSKLGFARQDAKPWWNQLFLQK
jgi:peptide/nickel transport system substrate-binding protein